MKIKTFDEPDLYWRVAVKLNAKEWPMPLDEQGDWLDRPVRQWVSDNFSFVDCFFAANGLIYFKNKEDAEWFRLTWEQA